MRVALVTYGSRGDIEPMLGFAGELRALGVDVRMCAAPDFAELLAAAGIPLTPIGWSVREMVKGEVGGDAPRPADSLSERARVLAASTYEAVTEVAAEGCDAVVATGLIPAGAGARAAAEKLGVPYVSVSYFPTYLRSPHHPPLEWPGLAIPEGAMDNRALWERNAAHMNTLFGGAVNAQRESVGLAPVGDVIDHVFTLRPWLAADPALAPWIEPADLDVVQTGAWIRPDSRPLPPEVAAFLAAGEPPVYVGFGSMPLQDAAGVARAAVAAARAHGRRVLLGSGWADLALSDEGDDCLVVGEVNQQDLFGRVAAAVHHGGAGTTTTAARAGAPQVVVPQIADQPYWAGRVAELGIGAAHDGPNPTFASLSAALGIALAPETLVRARALADTLVTDGAAVAAKLLVGRIG
ncbi:glycosyltransferase [Streptomyces sp. NPDC004111]|uniref:glycosyltransferase n=1 Tax=Streptomyces sp. NPDC004111 TaxID=3364690 RepID=UPI00369A18BE